MYSQGDILLVPLPFTDLSANKKRPVLVLSKRDYNDAADDIIVAAVTSNLDTKPYVVLFANKDMADGALKVDSYVRADKIYTLSQSIVIKRFGQVKFEVIEKVKGKILSVMNESDTPFKVQMAR
ncbi:MAG: type II toxin-antitoxin system PemK/MazF family toxin [Synergistaceae bacterium]|nr:type II toxin-antitoxin system PemK/MazF family toxin [Synergistaceae bacterium]